MLKSYYIGISNLLPKNDKAFGVNLHKSGKIYNFAVDLQSLAGRKLPVNIASLT